MIYFLQAELVGRIKIGFSTIGKLKKRMKALQVGSPLPLHLLLCIEGGREKEAVLHRRFRKYRVHGEWFVPGKRLLAYIAERQTAQPNLDLMEVELESHRALARRRNPPSRATRANDAARWLADAFTRRRCWTSKELFREARDAGLSRNAIFEAKEKIGLPKAKRTLDEDGVIQWIWSVPEGWTPPDPPGSDGTDGSVPDSHRSNGKRPD